MAPTAATARVPHVSKSIAPAQVSEVLFNAAKPTAATTTMPIKPAIEKRRWSHDRDHPRRSVGELTDDAMDAPRSPRRC